MLAIRRDVVDLDAGVVEINATVIRITSRGSALQERAKSGAGWRVIAISPELGGTVAGTELPHVTSR